MTILVAIFVFLFAYPFFVYPVLLKLTRSAARKPEPEREHPEMDWSRAPRVALVICALNEAKVIAAKLENSLALDYPDGKLTTYLVNDGSEDRTLDIARQYEARGIRIISREKRRGKVTNLNEVVPTREEGIVVQSDANVIYHPKAIRHLVARMQDPTVGCVSGRVILQETTGDLRQGEESYYSLEWFLQEKASEIYSMCGVDGAMHAYRRELFKPCPNDTLIEDFVMGMQFVAQGYRVVYEPDATAWERGPETLAEEFRRKVRIAAGAAQALIRGNGVPVSNAPGGFWFVWISHKLLRWLSPVFGILALVCAGFAAGELVPRIVLAGFAVIAALALVRWLTGLSNALLNTPFYFLFGQVAVARGLVRGVLGTQSVLWEKAKR
ncbi:MAG: glycosyltransferase family 2 protein [Bryobacteraceae bacterium]